MSPLECVAISAEAEAGCFWIPGLALLARNDGLVVFVIPAKLVPDPDPGAGIQGMRREVSFVSEQQREESLGETLRGVYPELDEGLRVTAPLCQSLTA